MNDVFSRVFYAGWGMMDFNAHMANRAFLDLAGDTRMMFFKENGFPMTEFERLGVGPVVKRDELDYYREFHLLEPITVELYIAGLSPDASRMRIRNVFLKSDGKKAGVVTSTGGWLDLKERRLTTPPEKLRDLLHSLVHSEDFEEFPNIKP